MLENPRDDGGRLDAGDDALAGLDLDGEHPPRAREPDKWMDRGTPAAAERADSTVEAVGEVNGAKNARRKGQSRKK
jgi:hypothetical protein